MRVVYVIGPYTAKTREECKNNIAAAVHTGVRVARKGYAPLIPHQNTALFDWDYNIGDATFWYEATAALLRRSDIAVLCAGAADSKGSQREIEICKELGIPVFASVDALPMANLVGGH